MDLSILVINDCDWIGFHIINDLLNDGYRVDAINIDSSQKSDHLAMFFNRNSSFNMITLDEVEAVYSIVIINSYESESRPFQFTQLPSEIKNILDQDSLTTEVIDQSFFFGEWMPMNEEGMYYQGQFISFTSELFLEKALYVKKLTNMMIHLIHENQRKSNLLIVLSPKNQLSEQLLEKNQSIRDNIPKEDLNIVLSHYHRYKKYY